MRMRLVGALALLLGPAATVPVEAQVEYVRVCDVYGVGFFYIPGTETCVHADTGRTASGGWGTDDPITYGESTLAARVSNLEARFSGPSFADVAISNALQDPDLTADENFGFRINWGAAGNSHALGFSGTAVLTRGFLADGTGRLAASGGIAFSGNRVGGRAGIQVTW